MTKSSAETYAMDGTLLSVQSIGILSRALSLHGQYLTQVQKVPKSTKVEPVVGKKDTLEATSLSVAPKGTHFRVLTLPERKLIRYETVPENRKLKPVSGAIIAFDEAGERWVVRWDKVEIEVVGPVTNTVCKITGTATTS